MGDTPVPRDAQGKRIATHPDAPNEISLHIERGHAMRIIAVWVGDMKFMPDSSVKDTDDWAAQAVASAKAASTPVGAVDVTPEQLLNDQTYKAWAPGPGDGAIVGEGIAAQLAPLKQTTLVDDLDTSVEPGRLIARQGEALRVAGFEIVRLKGELLAANNFREQLIAEEANTDRMSKLCDENRAQIIDQARNIDKKAAVIEQLQADLTTRTKTAADLLQVECDLKIEIARLNRMLDEKSKIIDEAQDKIARAEGVTRGAILSSEAWSRRCRDAERERDSKAATVKDLLVDIDNRNRVIVERGDEILRLRKDPNCDHVYDADRASLSAIFIGTDASKRSASLVRARSLEERVTDLEERVTDLERRLDANPGDQP